MRAIIVAILLAVSLPVESGIEGPAAPSRAEPAALTLGVMTFNIRYGTANDGPNSWPNRNQLVFDVIKERDADIVGLQEALRFQLDEITAAVDGYAEIGVGRADGRTGGEASPILYRTSRFAVAAAGTFWLSDTPQRVASKSWGNSIPRICTWARLIDKASGDGVYVLNSHFDHRSDPSRTRSAGLIAEFVRNLPFNDPVILMGDFNAGEDSRAIALLTRPDEDGGPAMFVDTFRAAHPDQEDAGTFNGWTGQTDGPKIDYVLAPPGAIIQGAAIIRTSRDGRYPSDHFPVWAMVQLPAPADGR